MALRFAGVSITLGSTALTRTPLGIASAATDCASATTAAFDAPSVDKPFDLKKGTWGAWELAARYSTIDLNYAENSAVVANRVRGGEQDIWSAGVNWFPNPAVKFMLDYSRVSIDRRNAAGLSLDQDFQTINLRSQVAF